ncbi:hypothetical protein C4580_05105 [Candidatus Woesearchaeota archaeon]|nr:MAG: hypothetical protein C4580_05105 [Candidatus Woesearchaeota archaeon]
MSCLNPCASLTCSIRGKCQNRFCFCSEFLFFLSLHLLKTFKYCFV